MTPNPEPRASDVLLRFADRRRVALFAVLAAAYLAEFNGQWQIEPDSALYMVLGRNLALGRGYTYQGIPHELAYPGLPWALALLFRIFGSHAIVAADALMLCCGFAVLALTWRLFHLAFDRPTAVVVTLGLGFAYEFNRYCYEIMTDVPFLMGVMAVLAGHEAIFGRDHPRPRWWDWALLIGGLAVAMITRPTMYGLLAALAAAMLWSAIRQRSSRRLVLTFAVLGAAAILLLWRFHPGGYETFARGLLHADPGELRQRITDNILNLLNPTAARAVFGVPLGAWWLNGLFGAVLLVQGVALVRVRPLWGLWVAASLAMMIFILSHDRYVVEILPLLIFAWWRTLRTINLRLPGRLGNALFILLLVLPGLALNFGKMGINIVNQHRPDFLAYYKKGRFPPYIEMAHRLEPLTDPRDMILTPERFSRMLTYFSDRRASEPGDGDDQGPAPGGRLLVVYDPADDVFAQWLAQRHIRVHGPPLVFVARSKGKPPLTLMEVSQD